MMKMKWPAVICMVICAGVAQAQAQTAKQWQDRGFLTISVGGQPQSQTFTEVSRPQIYGESGTVTVPHKVGGGFLFDLGGGVRVWKNLAVGLSISHVGEKEQANVTALVPNPLISDTPRTATATTGDLSHSETAVNIQFLWMLPLTDKFSIAAIAGPSFIHVSQDLVTGITATENAPPPFTTVTIASLATGSQSGWAKGVNVGADLMYGLTPSVNAGVFLRLLTGSADLQTASGDTINVEAGGFQFGAGIRYRF